MTGWTQQKEGLAEIVAGERERYVDKRIAPDLRPWLSGHRYGDVEIDLLAEWVRWTHFYGAKAFATFSHNWRKE